MIAKCFINIKEKEIFPLWRLNKYELIDSCSKKARANSRGSSFNNKENSKEDYLGYKANEQIFDKLIITEIFSKTSCSESEDAQQSIVTAFAEILWIIQKEPDENCLFWV